MHRHKQSLPLHPLFLALATLIVIANLSSVTAYFRTEFFPCPDRPDKIGVSVQPLYCDMSKLTSQGYICGDINCRAPKTSCIKNLSRDPIDQAKFMLLATGASCQLNRAQFKIVEHK
ncbi:MAG: hypothetical protein J3R72DRAFT_454289 [Linnemannia gamsii]|nr:MAG: hypothetical protein J3R72DRAFT_454289 [Linnemannia gamsii]